MGIGTIIKESQLAAIFGGLYGTIKVALLRRWYGRVVCHYPSGVIVAEYGDKVDMINPEEKYPCLEVWHAQGVWHVRLNPETVTSEVSDDVRRHRAFLDIGAVAGWDREGRMCGEEIG